MSAARPSTTARLFFLALAVRLVPALFIHGTDDVTAWETWGRMLATGGNPYASKYLIAWPPLWLPVAWASYLTADITGIPFAFLAKLLPIAADVVIVFLLYAATNNEWTALAYALNPLAIYTSAVHGNFDPLPTLCLTAAVVNAQRPDARRAGLWVGLGGAFKTWPLLLLPAIIAPLRTFRDRARAALLAVGLFVAALLLALPFGKSAVTGVIGYRSTIGWIGLSSLAFLRGGPMPEAMLQWIFYGAMAAVALFLIVRRTPAAEGTLLLLLTFFVTTPGFGLQYLMWIVPVALLADRRRALAYSVLGGVLIAWEILARPYTGYLGDTVRILPHAGYARAYGGYADQAYTVIGRLFLWGFLCYWWLMTLFAQIFPARRFAPRPNDEGAEVKEKTCES